MNIGLRILKNTSYQVVGQCVHILLNFALFAMLARYLGVERYGTYSLVFVIMSFFVILTDFGVADIVVREISKDKTHAARIIKDLFFIKLGMGIIAFLLVTIVVSMMNYSRETFILVTTASISLLFISLSSVGLVMFRANLLMERAVVANVAKDIVLLLGTGAVVLWHGSLLAIVLATLPAHLINLCLVLFLMRDIVSAPTVPFSIEPWKRTFRAAAPLGLAYLIVSLYIGIDTVMLDKMVGDRAVGYYNASYKFVNQAIFIPIAFVTSVFPFMSEYWHKDRDKLKLLFQKSYDYMVLLAVPMGAAVTVTAPKLIGLVFGEDYTPSVASLRILIWAVVLMFQTIIFGFMMVALDQQKKSLVIDVCALAFNVGLNLALIPRLSFVGAAITTVATEVFVLVPTIYIIQRHIGYTLSLKGLFGSCALGLACAGLLVLSNGFNLAIQLAICAAGYIGFIFAFRLIPREDMRLLCNRVQEDGAL